MPRSTGAYDQPSKVSIPGVEYRNRLVMLRAKEPGCSRASNQLLSLRHRCRGTALAERRAHAWVPAAAVGGGSEITDRPNVATAHRVARTPSAWLLHWAELRGITTPALPGLRLPQLAAKNLVTAALLLFTATPLLVQHPVEAAAQPVASPGHNKRPADTQHHPTDAGKPPASGNRGEVEPSTLRYRVRSGDSLWTIARDHLGSGTRYLEIAKLNAKVLGGRPGFITPGTILQLPTSTPTDRDRRGQTVTVKRGDTLSGIAEDQLGDADRYPDIFKASRAITQPGNRHLTDPDDIDIGWTLKIPGPTTRKDTGQQPTPRTDDRGAKKDEPRSPGDRLSREPTAKTSATATPTTPRNASPPADRTRHAGADFAVLSRGSRRPVAIRHARCAVAVDRADRRRGRAFGILAAAAPGPSPQPVPEP
jgi:nucleoid-associated protein YgaU